MIFNRINLQLNWNSSYQVIVQKNTLYDDRNQLAKRKVEISRE